jgi:threonine aldolase
MNYIDLRSDTVTQPTKEMREAIYRAEVGDDVYGDDPTVTELERYAAEVSGKEAALFVPSGTFGNQLSLLTHCKRGDEVLLDEDCHIVMHEVGASSVIAGVQLRTLRSNKGELDPSELESKIRGYDIHFPTTGLISLENAHSNGRVIPLETMMAIYNISRKYSIPVHLDGARLFNAASYLNVTASEITKYCDSVMFCLSKGLCAPVGSMLAGSSKFIESARKGRKLMGGGLRQSGFLAAAGLVALKDMRDRLIFDHKNALYMANELSKLPYIRLNMDDLHINMVFFKVCKTNWDDCKFVKFMLDKRVKINSVENGEYRFVTNYWVEKSDIDYTIKQLREFIEV